MKLFTKDIDTKLFEQYAKGSDLENQMVVAKIFNPYGNGTWYLLNSDPEDPEYLWAIVDMGDIEVGSVNRSDLENIKIRPFMLGLERDLSFRPVNALELYKGVNQGKNYAKGGMIVTSIKDIPNFQKRLDEGKITYRGLGMGKLYDDFYDLAGETGSRIKVDGKEYFITNTEFDTFNRGKDGLMRIRFAAPERKGYAKGGGVESENREMVLNNNKQIAHHTKEMSAAVKNSKYVPAWVVAKVNRSATDLSDATHYMEGEGESYAEGGEVTADERMSSLKNYPKLKF
jgi:hypothetical protein